MLIWELIGLVVLVSIALGVSLQDAFWGVTTFSIGITLLFVLVLVLSAFGSSIQSSSRNMFTPKAKAARAKRRKEETKNGVFSGLVFLWLVSPLLIGVLLALLANDFTLQHPILTFLIATVPFVAGCIAVLSISPKATKKRTR